MKNSIQYQPNTSITIDSLNEDIYERDEDGDSIVDKKSIVKEKFHRTIKAPLVAPYAKKNNTISIND